MKNLLKFAASILLLAAPLISCADSFYELLRYRCKPELDRIEIEYVGAYNEEGERLFSSRTSDDVAPWGLIVPEKAEEPKFIVGTKTEHRRCRLSDGIYEIKLSPSPCNYDVQGMNGGMMMVQADVRLRGRRIAQVHFGACTSEGQVNTKLLVRPGKPFMVEQKPAEEYFR